MMHQEWFEDGDTAAQQRACGFNINAVRERNDPLPVGAQLVGETAFIKDGGNCAFQTVDLVAADTGIAMAAATGGPANADALANFKPFILSSGTECDRAADHFVSGNQWIAGEAPFVVDHRQIRVANPAIIDLHFDVFCLQLARIVFVQFKFCTCLRRGIAFYLRHRLSPVLV
ncbi:hypothetical protein D3C85_1254150 [compost metagenome]